MSSYAFFSIESFKKLLANLDVKDLIRGAHPAEMPYALNFWNALCIKFLLSVYSFVYNKAGCMCSKESKSEPETVVVLW